MLGQRRRVTVAGASVVAPTKPTLTAPGAGDVYPGVSVTVSATVTAGQVPDRVDFVLDPGGSEVVVATDSSSPYSQSWTPAQAVGSHTLVARFVYGSGHVDSDPTNVRIFAPSLLAPTLELNADALTAGAVASWANTGSAAGTFTASGTNRPTCTAAAVNGHKSVDFDGVDDFMSSTKTVANIITASAFGLFAVCYLDSLDTAAAASYNNEALLCDDGSQWGIHLKSTPLVINYEWAGADTHADATPATGAWALLQARHISGALKAQWADGAEASAAGGDLSTLTGTLRLCRVGAEFAHLRIAYLAAFNTAIDGADVTAMRNWAAAIYGVTV